MSELNVKAASSACECRARAAINSPGGRSGLAWHVGTFGIIADAPVNDWQAAFNHPEVATLCRGMT